MLPAYEAETLLAAWGAHLRGEIEREVGFPDHAAGCGDYHAPDWTGQAAAAPHVSREDIDRACWVMVVLLSRRPRVHRDALDHYRDGCRLGWERLETVRLEFARLWGEWERVRGPCNSA